jgi:hypothetical protein
MKPLKKSFMSRNVSLSWFSKKYLGDCKSPKGVNVSEFMEKVHRELNYNISSNKAYRIRLISREIIEGKYTL